jgi:hypothetical protein
MVFREIIYAYCENNKKHIDTLCVEKIQSFNKLKQLVQVGFKGLKRVVICF